MSGYGFFPPPEGARLRPVVTQPDQTAADQTAADQTAQLREKLARLERANRVLEAEVSVLRARVGQQQAELDHADMSFRGIGARFYSPDGQDGPDDPKDAA